MVTTKWSREKVRKSRKNPKGYGRIIGISVYDKETAIILLKKLLDFYDTGGKIKVKKKE